MIYSRKSADMGKEFSDPLIRDYVTVLLVLTLSLNSTLNL